MLYQIAAPPYMNSKPLIWALRECPKVNCKLVAPSKIADMLKTKKINTGLVSVVALFSNPNLGIVPNISISCQNFAESAKLFHKVPIGEIQSVALDTSSLSSVLLAKVILKEKFGLNPIFVPMPPVLHDMLEACDAAVTIGDVTMCNTENYLETDLGHEWYELTGLPFVFAVWATDKNSYSDELGNILLHSKLYGITHLQQIAMEESQRLGLPVEKCYHYLANIMDYNLTELHLQAIALFRKKASQHGFITHAHEPEILSPSI